MLRHSHHSTTAWVYENDSVMLRECYYLIVLLPPFFSHLIIPNSIQKQKWGQKHKKKRNGVKVEKRWLSAKRRDFLHIRWVSRFTGCSNCHSPFGNNGWAFFGFSLADQEESTHILTRDLGFAEKGSDPAQSSILLEASLLELSFPLRVTALRDAFDSRPSRITRMFPSTNNRQLTSRVTK